MSLPARRRVGAFACLSCLSLALWAAQSDTGGRVPHLTAFINRALVANPEVLAAQAAVEVAQARLRGAGFPLNNPELELEAERSEINTLSVGIRQTLDWHDKRSARADVVQADLAATEARLQAVRLAKAGELLAALAAAASAQQVAVLAQRRVQTLERFAQLAERRHSAGDLPQAELELARLSLAEAAMQQAGRSAALIQARNRVFEGSGELPDAALALPEHAPVLAGDLDAERLAQTHPQVVAALRTAQVARARALAADRERRVDPTIGLKAGREDREGLIGLSLSIPLPVRNDFRSGVDAAQAEALQAERDAQQTYRVAQGRIQAAREGYNLIANNWAAWQARGNLTLQRRAGLLDAQWQAGELDTTAYLLQLQQTLDTQIAAAELRRDLWQAWAEWLIASGRLNDWLNETKKGP